VTQLTKTGDEYTDLTSLEQADDTEYFIYLGCLGMDFLILVIDVEVEVG